MQGLLHQSCHDQSEHCIPPTDCCYSLIGQNYVWPGEPSRGLLSVFFEVGSNKLSRTCTITITVNSVRTAKWLLTILLKQTVHRWSSKYCQEYQASFAAITIATARTTSTTNSDRCMFASQQTQSKHSSFCQNTNISPQFLDRGTTLVKQKTHITLHSNVEVNNGISKC